MPRGGKKKRRSRRQATPNGFEILDSLIDRGVRSVVDAVGQRMSVALEPADYDEEQLEAGYPCAACGAPTGRVCFMCRKPFCAAHTEFHNDEGWAICGNCISFMVQSAQMRMRRIVAAQQRPRPQAPPAAAAPPAPPGPTPWEVLGVSPHADLDAIRKAYHKICMATHPDRHPGDEEKLATFKLASEAYATMKAALESQSTARAS